MRKFALPIVFILVFFSFVVPNKAVSQGVGGFYFGGPILFSIPCTCNGNYLMYVLDYKDKEVKILLYQQGASRLYSYYNIYESGTYLLGSYDPYGVCLMEEGPDCDSWSNDGMINSRPGAGTSL